MLFKLKSTEYCVSRGISYRNRCTCGRGTNVDFVLHKENEISIADIGKDLVLRRYVLRNKSFAGSPLGDQWHGHGGKLDQQASVLDAAFVCPRQVLLLLSSLCRVQ